MRLTARAAPARAGRFCGVVVAVAAMTVTAACGVGGATVDKAGGSVPPVVLRLASPYADLRDVPAVQYFVERVAKVSHGRIRIDVVDGWGDSSPDAEREVVRAVAAGAADLGVVGSRVFDTIGVRSFAALTAPMLIDSYALEGAVIRSSVAATMLAGVDPLGLDGLALLADSLRKPFGVTRPLLRPGDWRGIAFGTAASGGAAAAIRALGARPVEAFAAERSQAVIDGAIGGLEMGLWPGRAMVRDAPYVSANVTLWPQVDVVVVRRGRLASLSGRERAWLRLAAADAADRSTDLVEARERTRTLVSMCQLGARFAVASTTDLVALRAAFAPAYAGLTRDAPTRSAIAQILRLKRSLPRPPPPSLAVPVRCAPTQPAPSAALVTAPNLNGTYRYAITRAEATRAGMIDPGDVYPQVTTIMLKDGNVRGGCFGPEGATYTIAGDRITFHSGSYGCDIVADVTKHGDGDLRFSPVPPIEQGDAFTCFTKTWIKIA